MKIWLVNFRKDIRFLMDEVGKIFLLMFIVGEILTIVLMFYMELFMIEALVIPFISSIAISWFIFFLKGEPTPSEFKKHR